MNANAAAAVLTRHSNPRLIPNPPRLWTTANTENNTAIATLITAYLPNARTQGFITETNKFKTYAAAWRDRWNSSTELYMAGGNYPNASPTFPKDFPAAVQAEMLAAQ